MIETPRSAAATGTRLSFGGATSQPAPGETARRGGPLILPPAKLDDELVAEAARVKRAVALARGEAAAPAPVRDGSPAGPRAGERIGALLVKASVDEVAASVIAAMRTVGAAHERHLEAIELEAARRCELVAAQAELDAELIRLQGRQEARAIISAAQSRDGLDPATAEDEQLSEIGETFSRFSETVEAVIASGPYSRP